MLYPIPWRRATRGRGSPQHYNTRMTADLLFLRPDGTTAPLSAYLTAPHLLLVFLRHLA